jgi:hypothetical protein
MTTVVHSIKDIPYPLVVDNAFHPVNLNAATKRIGLDFVQKMCASLPNYPVTMDLILNIVLRSKRAQSVWATVFEHHGEPFYVIQNLAFTNTTLPYRRVLVVKLDAFIISYPMRIWDQVRSNLMHEEYVPSPLTKQLL